jgi:23S rRNA (guanosine2251-2'-O)-methyltransferase
MLRSAEALGLGRVLIIDDREQDDPGYSLCRGVALGAQKWLQVTFVASVAEALDWLREEGLAILAADNAPDAVPVARTRCTGPAALVIGSELEGLHPELRARADELVKVETRGFTTSFNASCATAVLLEQLTRQPGRRRVSPPPEQRQQLLCAWLRRTVRHHERILAELRQRGD